MCNENNDCKCISDILKVINILQKKAVRIDDEDNMCDRPALSCGHCLECNTRPIQLITCGRNGDDPLVMPTTTCAIPAAADACPVRQFSSVFRVERVDNCCCTCRVLVPEIDSVVRPERCSDCSCDYKATSSFFTIDLKCVCAVRCLNDTFVDCI